MKKNDKTLRSLWSILDSEPGSRSLNIWDALNRLADGEIEGEITPEVITSLLDFTPGRRETAEFFTPRLITKFMANMAATVNPKSILDPMCGSGLMLLNTKESCNAEIVHGVDINDTSCRISQALLGDGAIIHFGNVFHLGPTLNNHYDFILVDPPLGMRLSRDQVSSIIGNRHGTVCPQCGLVQGEGVKRCLFCGKWLIGRVQ